MATRVVVVGCGIFGAAAALELRNRGFDVRVLEAGGLPHPEAASTDISKVVRMEYGTDAAYMELAERSREGWLEWNERWRHEALPELYHETGVVMVCQDPMAAGGFEHDSYEMLLARGHSPERIGGAALSERFPAWEADAFVDGFFHAVGGYGESGAVVWALAREGRRKGIEILEGRPAARLLDEGGRVLGVEDRSGERHEADHVLLANGSWAAELLPELAASLRRTWHPVWHLRPERPELFRAKVFPVFTADVARTGYYGFPLHPVHAVVKIGHHGAGVEPGDEPDDSGHRDVPAARTEAFREFLADCFPSLASAQIVYTRLCPYCDTPDEDLWIANDPDRSGLTVASGGSGHGFKFAPMLGPLIADTVEGRQHDFAEKFRWRPDLRLDHGLEAARCRT
jgi:glycine/D-amino acid oxidase-like deaminating enzyme